MHEKGEKKCEKSEQRRPRAPKTLEIRRGPPQQNLSSNGTESAARESKRKQEKAKESQRKQKTAREGKSKQAQPTKEKTKTGASLS